MFLKKLPFNFLYKPLCENCSKPLSRCKIFCDPCQSELYYQLLNLPFDASLPCISIARLPYLKRLCCLANRSHKSFLIHGIASLIVLKLHLSCGWPKSVVRRPIFEKRTHNALFYQKLCQMTQIPLLPQELENSESLKIILN